MSEIRILNLCHKKSILVDIYRLSLLKSFFFSRHKIIYSVIGLKKLEKFIK